MGINEMIELWWYRFQSWFRKLPCKFNHHKKVAVYWDDDFGFRWQCERCYMREWSGTEHEDMLDIEEDE